MRIAIALVVAGAMLAGCAAGDTGPSGAGPSPTPAEELIVQAANYEVLEGETSRFIAGVLTPEQLFVSFGSVEIEFFYLGTREGAGTAEQGPSVTATFLPIDGEGSASDTPKAVPASEGRGVYAAEVTLDRAGFWAAQLTAELDGERKTGQAVFEVYEEPRYPAVGEAAPKTENLTIDTADAPTEAIDSRARDGVKLPDPELHQMTVAESIRRKEPAIVVISTPVYCVSQFCGPITDMVGELQRDHGDRANFIHIEVWRNFQDTVVNKGAAEWIYRQDDLTEPWVFLIGADGVIQARWDNVATRAEIEPFLEELPKLR
ncbi:MAG: hypothetical protein ACLGIB_02280 [Actinomycetota bacterium]